MLAGDPYPFTALEALHMLQILLITKGRPGSSPGSLSLDMIEATRQVNRRVGRILLKKRNVVEGLISFVVRHGSIQPTTDLGWVAHKVRHV